MFEGTGELLPGPYMAVALAWMSLAGNTPGVLVGLALTVTTTVRVPDPGEASVSKVVETTPATTVGGEPPGAIGLLATRVVCAGMGNLTSTPLVEFSATATYAATSGATILIAEPAEGSPFAFNEGQEEVSAPEPRHVASP